MKIACVKVDAHIQEKKCVKIEVIDQLTLKIKSKPRYNWRQKLIKIKTDNLNLDFSFKQKADGEKELNYLLNLYFERKMHKNNYSFSKIFLLNSFRFLHNIIGNKNDMISLFYADNTKTLIAKCLINNNLAAYILCVSRDETMYVLRISMDDNFKKYSPGILLIVETVNYLSKSIPSIKFLDFTRGDDSYKLEFGGLIHINYCFSF